MNTLQRPEYRVIQSQIFLLLLGSPHIQPWTTSYLNQSCINCVHRDWMSQIPEVPSYTSPVVPAVLEDPDWKRPWQAKFPPEQNHWTKLHPRFICLNQSLVSSSRTRICFLMWKCSWDGGERQINSTLPVLHPLRCAWDELKASSTPCLSRQHLSVNILFLLPTLARTEQQVKDDPESGEPGRSWVFKRFCGTSFEKNNSSG